jgi:hypothetical protein
MLDEDTVTLTKALPLSEGSPGMNDHADVLVPHDHRSLERRRGIHFHVRPADPGDLDPHDGTIIRNLRHCEVT